MADIGPLDNGSVLVETLVSLAILGLAAGMLLPGMTEAAGRIRQAEAIMLARSEAQSLFNEIGGDIPLMPGRRQISLGGGRVATLTVDDGIGATLKLHQIDVAIWQSGDLLLHLQTARLADPQGSWP